MITDVLDFQSRLQADLAEFWKEPRIDHLTGRPVTRIAGTFLDQKPVRGTRNPYWDVIRQMPLASLGDDVDGFMRPGPTNIILTPDAVWLLLGDHAELCQIYAYSICSPDDMRWMRRVLRGRPVVDIGAGGGYWAWQMTQHNINVVALDPYVPGDGHPYAGCRWTDIIPGGAADVADYPDRALFMSWPNLDDHGGSWATEALAAYEGDMLIYANAEPSMSAHLADYRFCAPGEFYETLNREWDLIGRAKHHVSWFAFNDTLQVFRRKNATEEKTPRLLASGARDRLMPAGI